MLTHSFDVAPMAFNDCMGVQYHQYHTTAITVPPSVAITWGCNLAGIHEWFGLRVTASNVQLRKCTIFLLKTKPIYSLRAQLLLWFSGSIDLLNCHLRRCRISCICCRIPSRLTPTEVFALATAQSPTDRGREMAITIHLYCSFFYFPYFSLTPTRAECGFKAHSQSWSPNHCNGGN
jgi:hypothetical protein